MHVAFGNQDMRQDSKRGAAALAGRLDRLLGWGAVAPLAAGALCAWLASGNWRAAAMSVTIIWGGAVLAFQAGVGRGLALGRGAAPSARRLALMLWLFGLAAGSMITLQPLTSLGLLIAGYLSLLLTLRSDTTTDPHGWRPPGHRPIQNLLAVVSLASVVARLLLQG